MINETFDGKTNYCTHKNTNTSGICDDCLGIQSLPKVEVSDFETGQIVLTVGSNTDKSKVIKLTPEGFYYNDKLVADDKEIYEKFKEVVLDMYQDYKNNNK